MRDQRVGQPDKPARAIRARQVVSACVCKRRSSGRRIGPVVWLQDEITLRQPRLAADLDGEIRHAVAVDIAQDQAVLEAKLARRG